MSEIILEFAEPLLDAAVDDREDRKALALAVCAWNASLLPEQSWEDFLRLQKSDFSNDEDIADDMERVFTSLVDRKNQFYPHARRFVLDYELTHSRSHRRLNVVSTPL